MASYDEDEDNVSNDNSSEEGDVDETMEDADDGDNDQDQDVDMDDNDENDNEDGDNDNEDGEEEGEGEGDGEDNEAEGEGDGEGDGDGDGDGGDDEDQEQDQDDNDDNDDHDPIDTPSKPRPMHRSPSRAIATPLTNGAAAHSDTLGVEARSKTATASLSPRGPIGRGPPVFIRPSIRPETITATTYDIVPTIAAPQSTSINAITALPDMRWVFTGGSDGYIRKYNWIDTVNGKQLLTVAQRHPFVDSVVKAGVLSSYWENTDTTLRTPTKDSEAPPVSPVYSLVVERQALWCMSGDETGAITMQSVRHREGTRIATLRHHTSAVSVLVLSPDERSVMSGGWDKQIHDIDLNNGAIKRTYAGSASQISAIESRPLSSVPVPKMSKDFITSRGTFSSNNADKPKTNGTLSLPENDKRASTTEPADATANGSQAGDLDSLFGDDDDGLLAPGFGDEEDDEFSKAIAKAPQQQGPVDEDNPNDVPLDPEEKPQSSKSEDTNNEPTAAVTSTDKSTAPESQTVTTDTSEDTIMPDTETTIPPPPIPPPAADPLSKSPIITSPSLTTKDDSANNLTPSSETTFLDATISGTLRIWDRRMPNPIATISPRMGTAPWSMSACWSTDGNYIYVGRRNNCVEEYSLHKSLHEPVRSLKFPGSSKSVSALKAMPNNRHLVCASHDILRLYDLQSDAGMDGPGKHAVVPFLIIPGHRTGVISHLFLDPTCRFMISTAGNRGWEGHNTEVLLGYEIHVLPPA